MELYLIRHGQSTNNALSNPSARVADAPLTELGLRQAEHLAEHLADGVIPDRSSPAAAADVAEPPKRGYGITHLYCSPMWRSLQTARPAGRALGLAPEVWIELHEHGGLYLDHGPERGRVGYPGKTRAEIAADFADYVLPDALTPAGWWRGDYEELDACYSRAGRVAEQLLQRAASDASLALITHGTFIDALLKQLFGGTGHPDLYLVHYNTGITRLDFYTSGRVVARYLNRIGHLPPEMVS